MKTKKDRVVLRTEPIDTYDTPPLTPDMYPAP